MGKILSTNPSDEEIKKDKIKNRILPSLWYKFFHKKNDVPDFNSVVLPKVKRKFR